MPRFFSRFVPHWFCPLLALLHLHVLQPNKIMHGEKDISCPKVRLSAFEATPLKLDINSSAICALSIKVYILTSNLAAVFLLHLEI